MAHLVRGAAGRGSGMEIAPIGQPPIASVKLRGNRAAGARTSVVCRSNIDDRKRRLVRAKGNELRQSA
jgi:hypothetical protein